MHLRQEIAADFFAEFLIPAFSNLAFSIDFNWVKNVFTLALCEAALACRTFARLSKCSFLASPSFLWLRSRNNSSWSFNFSAEKEKEEKSFKAVWNLCMLTFWHVHNFVRYHYLFMGYTVEIAQKVVVCDRNFVIRIIVPKRLIIDETF